MHLQDHSINFEKCKIWHSIPFSPPWAPLSCIYPCNTILHLFQTYYTGSPSLDPSHIYLCNIESPLLGPLTLTSIPVILSPPSSGLLLSSGVTFSVSHKAASVRFILLRSRAFLQSSVLNPISYRLDSLLAAE